MKTNKSTLYITTLFAVILSLTKVMAMEVFQESPATEDSVRKESTSARTGWMHHSFNFDLGLNNYVNNWTFPDASNEPYTLKPIGSWYVALNSVNNSRIFGPFYMDYGGGVSWYNFKFEDPMIRVLKGTDAVLFEPDGNAYNSYKKSKLTAAYINVFMVPIIHFSDGRGSRSYHDFSREGFRIGAGAYAGYRVSSYNKAVFDSGKKDDMKNKSNFYLSNFRYGARVQVGWKATDVFFNYDLSPLFEPGKGPDLNAFSFGIIF
ncbi:MAG: hypothetical protein OEX02_14490 [Cyclobacteriaceae bacterium]|nr:hypothetical protein [Cyclobacteriaceae bacterium]